MSRIDPNAEDAILLDAERESQSARWEIFCRGRLERPALTPEQKRAAQKVDIGPTWWKS